MKRLAVYCGAYTGKNPAYRLAATQLGKMMNERDLELVYGGGTVGLMGIIAQSVLDGGGKVHGIMPHFF
ncbi:LOG family protein [Fructilactobacillus florum]|uniref:LOG family protein n=1 Tax=Fructilactobacillus florum TaxID=640331 RepID=UPI000B309797